MNDWLNELQKQLEQAIDQAASDLGQQCEEAVDQADLWLTEAFETIEETIYTVTAELTAQTEPLISPELRQAFDEFELWLDECDRAIEAALNTLIEIGLEEPDEDEAESTESRDRRPPNSPETPGDRENQADQADQDTDNDPYGFVTLSHVRPTAKRYPACRGCQHYHGYRYGEHLLVCAMHPHGWDDEQCPDWEGDR